MSDKVQPVCRKSRRRFVWITTGIAMIAAILLSFYGKDTKTTQILVEGLMGYCTMALIMYVGASAADYSTSNFAKYKFKNKNVEVSNDES